MLLTALAVFSICLLASTAGAICGIGGGVIIKPVLDAMHIMDVHQVSFLSSCTVLCMSAYSVFASLKGDPVPLRRKTVWPLGIGAAIGGLLGRALYSAIGKRADFVAFLQAACLFVLLLGTLIYMLREKTIRTHDTDSSPVSALIGLSLGFFSSFLGIGGGPFNLVVLSFFFSMDTKVAARHSLCVILVSQTANILSAFVSGSVPSVSPTMLLLMAAGGIGGGIVGRRINKKLTAADVKKLFLALLLVIIGACIYNMLRAVQ